MGGRLAGVLAGYAPEVDDQACRLADSFSRYELPEADVLVVGLPQRLPYEDSNNHLVAAVGMLVPTRVWVNRRVLRAGGVVIGLTPSRARRPAEVSIVPGRHRPVRPYHAIPSLANHEEEFAHDPDYLRAYSYGYHALHAFWLFYQLDYGLRRAAAAVVAGTTNPGAFRSLGLVPVADFERAWALATRSWDATG